MNDYYKKCPLPKPQTRRKKKLCNGWKESLTVIAITTEHLMPRGTKYLEDQTGKLVSNAGSRWMSARPVIGNWKQT